MDGEKIKQDKKGRLLALRDFMYSFTDEHHPVSTQALIEEMKHQGYPGNRKTIKDDIDVLNKFGMNIITNVSRENSFYMASREFETSELKLLVDAVSSSRFISVAKSDQLINKLSKMTSIYEKDTIAPRIITNDRIKADNPQLFYVIDKLISAVQLKRKVSFQYEEFDADKRRVLRNDGEIYINSPYGCLWSDDFYYLIGYSEKRSKVITFRVDRIIDLEILDEEIIPEPEGFIISDYAQKIVEMFDGEPQKVELICDNELMKSVIDKFGENIKTEKVSDTQFRAIINVATSKTFYAWCFRFAGKMKIVGPKKVKAEYIEMAKMILCE